MTGERRETKRIIGVVATGFVAIVVIARLTNDPSRQRPLPPADAGLDGAGSTDGGRDAEASAPCVMPSFDGAMKRARASATEGRGADALVAYQEAIRARPFDAEAWAASGHLRAAIPGDALALRDLATARALTTDDASLASIAFDEGLVHEHAKDAARARIAFARAEVYGSKDAASKLGPGSHCTATVDRRPNDLDFARTWRDVLARMSGPGCETPDAEDDAEARALACGGCDAGTWKKGRCEGDGPWTVAMGTKECVAHTAIIRRVQDARFWVDATPSRGATLKHEGKRFVLATTNDAVVPVVMDGGFRYLADGWSPGKCRADEQSSVPPTTIPGCAPAKGITVRDGEGLSVHDEAGKHLVTVRTYDTHARMAIEGDVVRVTGAGCDLRVGIDAAVK